MRSTSCGRSVRSRNADGSTNPQRLGQLRFGRQSIARNEFPFDDVLLDLFSGLIPNLGTTQCLHETSLARLRIPNTCDRLSDNPILSTLFAPFAPYKAAMPTVAITDYTFPNLEVEQAILLAAGFELRSGNDKQVPAPQALVAEADAVITQFAPINAEVIGAMQRAKIIVRYGIGYDNVDVKAARERGIPVCNIPDYCIDEVADHTLARSQLTTSTRCSLTAIQARNSTCRRIRSHGLN